MPLGVVQTQPHGGEEAMREVPGVEDGSSGKTRPEVVSPLPTWRRLMTATQAVHKGCFNVRARGGTQGRPMIRWQSPRAPEMDQMKGQREPELVGRDKAASRGTRIATRDYHGSPSPRPDRLLGSEGTTYCCSRNKGSPGFVGLRWEQAGQGTPDASAIWGRLHRSCRVSNQPCLQAEG